MKWISKHSKSISIYVAIGGTIIFLLAFAVSGVISARQDVDTELAEIIVSQEKEIQNLKDGSQNLGESLLILKGVSGNKTSRIAELDSEILALEIDNRSLAREIKALRIHIESLPGEAGYQSISEAWAFCQEELADALRYKNSLIVLTEFWEGQRLALERVDNRTDITTTSNLTQEKRDHFYEMWDIWHDTLR